MKKEEVHRIIEEYPFLRDIIDNRAADTDDIAQPGNDRKVMLQLRDAATCRKHDGLSAVMGPGNITKRSFRNLLASFRRVLSMSNAISW